MYMYMYVRFPALFPHPVAHMSLDSRSSWHLIKYFAGDDDMLTVIYNIKVDRILGRSARNMATCRKFRRFH